MLSIQTLIVGDLQTNCYLVSDNQTDDTIIIDPGEEGDFITQTIIDQKLQPKSIILTHGHFDHILGCLELKLNFNIPIYINKNDLKLYTSANQSAKHWLKKEVLKVPPTIQFIKDNDKIKFGNKTLIVLETPGHTPGSICLYYSSNDKSKMSNEQYLFTGDTLFADGSGRTDLSYSNPLQLTKSLEKLFKLPKNTLTYPGHGGYFLLNTFSVKSKISKPRSNIKAS